MYTRLTSSNLNTSRSLFCVGFLLSLFPFDTFPHTTPHTLISKLCRVFVSIAGQLLRYFRSRVEIFSTFTTMISQRCTRMSLALLLLSVNVVLVSSFIPGGATILNMKSQRGGMGDVCTHHRRYVVFGSGRPLVTPSLPFPPLDSSLYLDMSTHTDRR